MAESEGWHTEWIKEERKSVEKKDYSTKDLCGTEEKPGRLYNALKNCVSGDLSKKDGNKLIVINCY